MLLSRFWYVLLAIAAGVAFYIAFLAVGQFNRKDNRLMTEGLASDSQTVEYVIKIDSRRRLDRLLVGSADKGLGDALVGAYGKRPIPPPSKDGAKKALASISQQIPQEFRPDLLFAVDREGRVIGEVGYDAVQNNEDFELGGYPAVFDALHGFLRDDTWVWDGRLYMVSARPVETQAGEPPAGAIVGLKEINKAYAADIARRTRTNLAFYAGGNPVAVATPPRDGPPGPRDVVDNQLQEIKEELPKLTDDANYECPATTQGAQPCAGRTSVRPMSGDNLGVMYARLNGDAWDQHAGFAVVRPTSPITSPFGFLSNADDKDTKSAPIVLIAIAVFFAMALGIGFTVLEHTIPLSELGRQAQAMRDGKLDFLQVPRFHGTYRLAAQNLNAGMERVVEKGGGVGRKAADLESILGPVPAQPAMSAFSFPMDGNNQPPPPAQSGPVISQAVANAPPPNALFAPPPGSGPRPQPPPSSMSKPTPPVAFSPGGSAPNPFPAPPPPPPPAARPPGPPPTPGPARAAPTPGPAMTRPGPGLAAPPPPPAPPVQQGQAKVGGEDQDDEEATMVAPIPADVLAQATGENKKADAEAAEWLTVYEDFIRTKKQCGEPTDGLTYEKFQHTLKKNRDALIARHNCKRVKFSVYVKEGRASLKATPVKE